MTKIKALLVTMATAATVLVGTTSSAQATEPTYFGPWSCLTYRDIATCVSLDWARQADGTGVRLEGIQVMTSQGCGSLEDSGKYDPVRANAINKNTGYMDYQYNFGEEDCNFYKDVSNAVGDSGPALIEVSMHARIDWAGDRQVNWVIELGPGGGHTVMAKWVKDI